MDRTLHNNKRLAKNTLYLYFRTFLVMFIAIFTSRVVLDSLGVENYGIYNVVGGFVSMFTVLSGTLTAASQRFIAYELGKEKQEIKKVFSTTLSIHFLLSIVIFFLLESFGIWFLNNQMNISAERLPAANWAFQCSIVTFCINIISIPYNAAIIAYEKMSVFAYISIFEVLAKLGIAYALYIVSSDVLIIYAILMLVVAIVMRLIYGWYCNKTFKECRYAFQFDKRVFKDIIGFCGWNFIGSSATVLNGQGINLLINIFFGVFLNAARGLAAQVESALNSFVQNFVMALNPQITKTYASGDFVYVNKVVYSGTKYIFYLFLILCAPIFFNTEYILSLWLKQVPDYTAVFVRYGIIYSLCQSLSQCLYITMLASGNIKRYQIIVGTLSLMAFPVAYIFFKLGFPCEYGYVSMILFSLICFIIRLFLLKDILPGFSISLFVNRTLLPILSSFCLTAVCLFNLYNIISVNSIISFVLICFISVFLVFIFIFFIGLQRVERLYIINIFETKLRRIL
jgi:O-antigen/teichoic acid export membrane protein